MQTLTPPTDLDGAQPINTEERLEEARQFRRALREADLLTEMADALDVLLEYRDKPLPKFVSLDLAAIRALVEQARAVAVS